MKQVYMDINDIERRGRGGAAMFAFIKRADEQISVTPCGAHMYIMPYDNYNRAYAIASDCLGIGFLFDDQPVRANFYPVPCMEVFARDWRGGWFCSHRPGVDMDDSGDAIYYVDERRNCTYIAPNLRALMTAAILDTTFMAKVGCAGGLDELSYADQQYMIDCMGIKASDAAHPDDMRPAPEVRIYLCREMAERELEFVNPLPWPGRRPGADNAGQDDRH